MKALEVRKLSSSEINEKIFQNKKELMNLRFQNLSEVKNTSRFRVLKREIARLRTILMEKIVGEKNA
jgi:large subunit ribosomal protein L29